MINFLRAMGMHEFPWTTVGVWAGVGLFVAIGIRLAFWRNENPGIHIDFGLAFLGPLIGAFLAVCYYVVVRRCDLIFCGS